MHCYEFIVTLDSGLTRTIKIDDADSVRQAYYYARQEVDESWGDEVVDVKLVSE